MPLFQVSTRSRNGVKRDDAAAAEIEDEQQPELERLIERCGGDRNA